MRRATAPGNDKVQRIAQNYFISLEIASYKLSDLWDYKAASLLLLLFLWRCDPTRVMSSSFLMFLDHTQ